ncbi:hypothetical protein AB0F91_05690 [Amycolatopsis sp. NPDC023774]|uniref:hypothetical protein n=1 Tax=Amycolatopsis sp. NPDC023774 TaxID=3155015 RepID=UPI0033C25A9E
MEGRPTRKYLRGDAGRLDPGGTFRPGVSTVDKFRAVTSVAEGVCGPGHRKGRLAPGFDAGVLAVGGNPFTGAAVVLDSRAVYVRGAAVTAALPR